ncbi:MAG: hypothetical protein PHS16_02985 [Candidatus Colwellbacteria bacterium]|jgi:uncharacterized membrane protein YesL|nr:hypothetical protein [Candidatus Colwellbacteria bacterium]MDD3752868.1 hypothetical protein [Candidatus Colwellbacteria bacterium]MDD4819053.1 hypothetical protein [Candidatus Colwellbacteria bacterium]
MENKPKLSKFGSLIKGAVDDFKSRIKIIIGLSALTLAVSFIMPALIASSVIAGVFNIAVGIAVGIVSFILFLLAMYFVNGAYVYSMKEGASIKESFKFVWKNFRPFIWILALTVLVVVPGIVALVIPGLVISILVSFALFIFMDQGVKGADSLVKSREYVRGYFWPLVGKLTLLALVTIGVMIVVAIIAGIFGAISESLEDIINSLFSIFVITPISLCFSWRLYRDLKEKNEASVSGGQEIKSNIWVKALAIIGGVITIAGIVLVCIFAPKINEFIKENNPKEEAPSYFLEESPAGNESFNQELQQILEGIE